MQAIKKMAKFAKNLGNVERLEVLPFHKMGEYKWEAMDEMDYELFDTEEPTAELLDHVKSIFKNEGLTVY